MANGELIDAREAMELLGIGENELQNLVARGDLRAFRSAGTMKFRRDDIVNLKGEKGTEPTIIIPPASGSKPGQSGILTSAKAGPSGSGIKKKPGEKTDATGEIVFEDIELMPDEAMQTQEQTVVASGVQTGVSEAATLVESGVSSAQTGDMTAVETGEQAKVSTGPAVPVQTAPKVATGSRVGPAVGPAVSRVRKAAVAQGARRTQTVYEPKTSHPIMTTILILTVCVSLFTLSVFGVMVFKGHYDEDAVEHRGSQERILPPFLVKMGVYDSNYYGSWFTVLPGKPNDRRPKGEFPFSDKENPE